MTKLLEWLSLSTVIAIVWIAAFTNKILPQFRTEILWSPAVLVILFGLYSVLTIAYRYNLLVKTITPFIYLFYAIVYDDFLQFNYASHIQINLLIVTYVLELLLSMTVRMLQKNCKNK